MSGSCRAVGMYRYPEYAIEFQGFQEEVWFHLICLLTYERILLTQYCPVFSRLFFLGD